MSPGHDGSEKKNQRRNDSRGLHGLGEGLLSPVVEGGLGGIPAIDDAGQGGQRLAGASITDPGKAEAVSSSSPPRCAR